jgi:hypothetical protein
LRSKTGPPKQRRASSPKQRGVEPGASVQRPSAALWRRTSLRLVCRISFLVAGGAKARNCRTDRSRRQGKGPKRVRWDSANERRLFRSVFRLRPAGTAVVKAEHRAAFGCSGRARSAPCFLAFWCSSREHARPSLVLRRSTLLTLFLAFWQHSAGAEALEDGVFGTKLALGCGDDDARRWDCGILGCSLERRAPGRWNILFPMGFPGFRRKFGIPVNAGEFRGNGVKFPPGISPLFHSSSSLSP